MQSYNGKSAARHRKSNKASESIVQRSSGSPNIYQYRPRKPPLTINGLPPKILSNIFYFYIHSDGWEKSHIERLFGVCRHWAKLIKHDEVLWTRVNLEIHFWYSGYQQYQDRCNYVQCHLKRSGTLPLRVSINLAPYEGFEHRLHQHVEFVQGVLGSLMGKHIKRWSELVVEYNHATPNTLLSFLGIHMPELIVFKIVNGNMSQLPTMGLPKLHHLSTNSVSFPIGINPLSLTCLIIEEAILGLTQVQALLQCKNLTTMAIHRLRYIDGSVMVGELPKLSLLEFRHNFLSGLNFLRLPRLRTLRIPGDVSSLIDLSYMPEASALIYLELWDYSGRSVVPEDTILLSALGVCSRLKYVTAHPAMASVFSELLKQYPTLGNRLRVTSLSRHKT